MEMHAARERGGKWFELTLDRGRRRMRGLDLGMRDGVKLQGGEVEEVSLVLLLLASCVRWKL